MLYFYKTFDLELRKNERQIAGEVDISPEYVCLSKNATINGKSCAADDLNLLLSKGKIC